MQLNTSKKAKQKVKPTLTELRQLESALAVAKAASGVALAAGDMELREAADKAINALDVLRMGLTKQPAAVDPEQEAPFGDDRDADEDDSDGRSSKGIRPQK